MSHVGGITADEYVCVPLQETIDFGRTFFEPVLDVDFLRCFSRERGDHVELIPKNVFVLLFRYSSQQFSPSW